MYRGLALAALLAGWLGAAGVTPARAATRIEPQSLALPPAAFAPAVITHAFVDPNKNVRDADYWPRSEHRVSYARFGRTKGYYQSARWALPGHSGKLLYEYEASVFKKAQGALGAWHDGSAYHLSFTGVTLQDCPIAGSVTCTRVYVVFQDNSVGYFDLIASGRCLIESRVAGTKKQFTAGGAQLLATLDAIDEAASGLTSQYCTA